MAFTHWFGRNPITCEIGYQHENFGAESFYEKIRDAQPMLVHIGHDVPVSSWMGPVILHGLTDVEYLDPEEIPARIESIRAHVRKLHEAGAVSVIPYICTMLCCGNPDTRIGWWRLLDRWEEFAHLGLGEKPEDDPVDWNQSPVRPLPEDHVHNVYEPSVVAPAWRRFLNVCVDLAAQCDYDGTFLDVNAYWGTGKYDLAAFTQYLDDRYSAKERAELFGFDSDDAIRFGDEQGTLLRYETLRYRAVTMGRLFAELRDTGRKHVPDFWVYPNNSPMGSVDAFYERREVGHQIRYLHRACRYLVFEEMQQPGRFGADRINDHILQYRYALARSAGSTVLPYHATDEAAIRLANAECAANSGAMFVHPGFEGGSAVRFWTDWFAHHRERHDGLRSVHNVGVVFFADEMFRDDRMHIESVYRIRQALSDNHVLFDFIVEDNLAAETLGTFDAVVVARVGVFTAEHETALASFVAEGGKLLIIGECGGLDERLNPRGNYLSDRITGPNVRYVASLDDVVPPRGPELFDLTEEQLNNIDYVLGLPDRVSSTRAAHVARKVSLITVLEQLTGARLRKLDDEMPYTLRISAFIDPERNRILVHLVNYDLPVRATGVSGAVVPVQNVRLPFEGIDARYWTPEGIDDEPCIENGQVVIPEVKSYALVEIDRG